MARPTDICRITITYDLKEKKLVHNDAGALAEDTDLRGVTSLLTYGPHEASKTAK